MSTNFKRGQVWRALVPYNDEPVKGKERPVIVVGWSQMGQDQDNVVLVIPVTTFGDGGRPAEGDVEILDQQRGGLNKSPSWARARRVWGADPRCFDRRRGCTGTVTPEVMAAILVQIEKMFAVY